MEKTNRISAEKILEANANKTYKVTDGCAWVMVEDAWRKGT